MMNKSNKGVLIHFERILIVVYYFQLNDHVQSNVEVIHVSYNDEHNRIIEQHFLGMKILHIDRIQASLNCYIDMVCSSIE